MSRPVHFEIHTENPDRAIAFYTTLFGWQFKKWDGPMEYWMIITGADPQPGINGGLVRRRGPAPAEGQAVNAFVNTIGVGDLDAALQKLTTLGGTIALPKMPIPTMGYLAYAKDTDGNLFGMMQPDPSAK
jgi:predicted enzyme related to lactoylglutathione lyase